MNLTNKYKPKYVKELIGRESEINQIKSNIKKPILLYGPSGSGKTITAHCIANDLNYDLIELNASDFRNKDEINNIIGNSIKQRSLFNKGKIILIDELDGISGREDRGGIQALLALLKDVSYPIIITANDPWNSKFSTLRKKCKIIEYKKINNEDILKVLIDICKKENIKINYEYLKELTRISGGDIRSCINDLEVLSYKDKIERKDILDLGEREKEDNIFNAIKLILKSDDPLIVMDAFNNTSCDLNESLLWLEENIPLEYQNKIDLNNAMEKLSKADVFRGRILKWQHWRFLSYVNQLLTAGVAISKKTKYYGFTRYKRPSRILNIWKFNQKNKEKKELAEKLSKEIHASKKRVLKELPYMKFLNI